MIRLVSVKLRLILTELLGFVSEPHHWKLVEVITNQFTFAFLTNLFTGYISHGFSILKN